jgi:membrane protease YdiL (CAAX protease family)
MFKLKIFFSFFAVKIIIYILVIIIFSILFGSFFEFLAKSILVGFNKEILNFTANLVTVLAFFVGYKICNRLLEKRETKELDFNMESLKLALFGIIFGSFLVSLSIFWIYIFGGIKFSLNQDFYVLIPLSFAITTSITEEIIFRGVIFRLMLQRMGIISAITISSLIFSLLHAFGSGLYAAIAIFIQTTFVLTVPYLLTKNLWFSIGIHFWWNFFQSGIFSYPIGDQNLSKGLFLI